VNDTTDIRQTLQTAVVNATAAMDALENDREQSRRRTVKALLALGDAYLAMTADPSEDRRCARCGCGEAWHSAHGCERCTCPGMEL